MPNNSQSLQDESSLSTTQKVVATIIGALVIGFFVLLIIGAVRLVQRFRSQTVPVSPSTTISTTTAPSSNKPEDQVVNDANTNYKNMPATGPTEDMIVLLFALVVIGTSSIAISKRIF